VAIERNVTNWCVCGMEQLLAVVCVAVWLCVFDVLIGKSNRYWRDNRRIAE
jgi:hypothetical protein